MKTLTDILTKVKEEKIVEIVTYVYGSPRYLTISDKKIVCTYEALPGCKSTERNIELMFDTHEDFKNDLKRFNVQKGFITMAE